MRRLTGVAEMTACAVEISLAQKLRADDQQDADEAIHTQLHAELITDRLAQYEASPQVFSAEFASELLLDEGEADVELERIVREERRSLVASFRKALALALKASAAHPNQKPELHQKAGEELASVIYEMAVLATEDQADVLFERELKKLAEGDF